MSIEDGTSIYRHTLSRQIIDTATTAFLSKGVKAVKMDDIANKLSISKRTLYELFANKESLLLECVKQMHADFKSHMEKFVKEKPSVIAIVIETFRYQINRINEMSPAYYYDLRKYPSIAKWAEEERRQNESKAMEFFHQGIEEGYFRSDVNYKLISKVNEVFANYIMENNFLKEYSIKQIFHNVILLYLRGYCTLKGVKALEEYNL